MKIAIEFLFNKKVKNLYAKIESTCSYSPLTDKLDKALKDVYNIIAEGNALITILEYDEYFKKNLLYRFRHNYENNYDVIKFTGVNQVDIIENLTLKEVKQHIKNSLKAIEEKETKTT